MIGERDPWDKLLDKLAEMGATATGSIVLGHPKTIEAYRHQVGYLEAVSEVKEEIKKILHIQPNSFTER